MPFASALRGLFDYPYGCAEQTTSRALPLLYLNDVATTLGLGNDDALDQRIKAIYVAFSLTVMCGLFICLSISVAFVTGGPCARGQRPRWTGRNCSPAQCPAAGWPGCLSGHPSGRRTS